MTDSEALRSLATALGVATEYTDGLGRHIQVAPATLARVCAALGAELERPDQARAALRAWEERARPRLAPVLVAWDGRLRVEPHGRPGALAGRGGAGAVVEALGVSVQLEAGGVLEWRGDGRASSPPLPPGIHRLVAEGPEGPSVATVICAPERAWAPEPGPGWGLAAHLAALRTGRSRALGDLADLEFLIDRVAERGGSAISLLPLLPTFNGAVAEPSPYSPVSRLFWSELVLDLGSASVPVPAPSRLSVTAADQEVRAVLAGRPRPPAERVEEELERYARFRGLQARFGRDWRAWPPGVEDDPRAPDREEETFHLVAQTEVRRQLARVAERCGEKGVGLALDLPLGVHPHGYDPWSRRHLFAEGMSVGAPPDALFPEGQDWGFAPLLPEASRQDGHRYLLSSVGHQARVADLLRIDHVMAADRLYWIPEGMARSEGTYVHYPQEEFFAVLNLASHRHRCRMIGENLGTVSPRIERALERHAVLGMYVAQFEATRPAARPPRPSEVGFVGTHDTPTLAGWIAGRDIEERVRCGLLDPERAEAARADREASVRTLAQVVGVASADPALLLQALYAWLASSESPLVLAWIEDLWLEPEPVNLPGTTSSERPNFQRPTGRTLEDVFEDPGIRELLRALTR